MLQNYLKIALRSLLRFKGFAIINLFGLSLGLTAGILIMMFVVDEFSFDKFHSKRDRIYRVVSEFYTNDSGAENAMETNAWPIGDILRREFPEVEAATYITNGSRFLIKQDDKRIRQNIQIVTPEFLQIFSFPLLKGNAATALNEPYSIVITEDMEKKYFSGQDAIDKNITLSDTLNFVVTGVMANVPQNSHMQFDMLMSFSTYQDIFRDFNFSEGWGNINMRNYILVKEGADAKALATKAYSLYTERVPGMLKSWNAKANVLLEPLNDTYLQGMAGNSMGPKGSIQRVYLVAGIAVFVILLACINFVNLATARSVYRAREVGLRKVSGSSRNGLIRQFLTESFVLTVISFALALVMTWLFLPWFNQLLQKNYSMNSFSNPVIIFGMLTLLVAITCLAGFYPALVMSSMNPVEVLKGKVQTSNKGVQLRRTLVIFQFVISSVLATGTLIVLDQLDYMQQQELGFEKDNIIVLNTGRAQAPTAEAHETFKNQLRSIAMVDAVTNCNALPGIPGWDGQIAYPEGAAQDAAVSLHYMAVDPDYVPTMDLEIVAGRNFDVTRAPDIKDGLLINETAAALMGWSPSEAINKKITSPSGYPEGEVIGVLKDYHQAGLQQQIGPLVMDILPRASYLYAIRYKASDTKQLISNLEGLWKENFAGHDFNYFFLDETFARQYKSEEELALVFGLFATITVAIAAIGLLGLVSFMVVARTKEIGVRKVLGAGVVSIIGLLSKEFVILVAVANIVAMPVAWYFAGEWLAGFAFRMSLNPMLFVWTLVAALALTLVTVSFQTIKAALTNPIKSLRYE
ncbi:MAG TPA: ABC transporter permease [Cyclobacteriaceae bacterium]|nr:ABC transporter permease [Cyclobacteriaceae bacterium]